MLTRDNIIDALTKCAGYDPVHFPRKSELIANAWCEHFNRWGGLTVQDLMEAVSEYYARPSQPVPQPADISVIARKLHRDRFDRLPLDAPERKAVEAVGDAKAAPEAQGGALPPGAAGELRALNSGCHVPAGTIERLRSQIGGIGTLAALNAAGPNPAFRKHIQARNATAPPQPLPCPDCGALEPCEHDNQEVPTQ